MGLSLVVSTAGTRHFMVCRIDLAVLGHGVRRSGIGRLNGHIFGDIGKRRIPALEGIVVRAVICLGRRRAGIACSFAV